MGQGLLGKQGGVRSGGSAGGSSVSGGWRCACGEGGALVVIAGGGGASRTTLVWALGRGIDSVYWLPVRARGWHVMRRAFCEMSRSGGVHPASGRTAGCLARAAVGDKLLSMTDSAIIPAPADVTKTNILTLILCVMRMLLLYIRYMHVCSCNRLHSCHDNRLSTHVQPRFHVTTQYPYHKTT